MKYVLSYCLAAVWGKKAQVSMYMCLQHVHVFTACTCVYSMYMCLQHVHVFTACTCVYSMYMCLQHHL